MSPRAKDRWRLTGRQIGVAGVGAAMLAISIGVLSSIGTGSDIPTPAPEATKLDLLAARDLGALPSRDSWCAGSDHCWVFQQSTGDATDYGDAGGWHLSKTGTPRVGVAAALPVTDATGWIDTTTEASFWADGANGHCFRRSPVVHSATAISMTAVLRHDGTTQWALDYGYNTGGGALMYLNGTGNVYLFAQGTSSQNISTTEQYDAGVWQCITVVADGTASKIYVNGAATTHAAMTAYGSWTTDNEILAVGGTSTCTNTVEAVARTAIHHSAITLADHQALCGGYWGTPAGGVGDDKPPLSVVSWTQTGDARCHPSSATTAACAPDSIVPHAWYGGALKWPVDRSSINRLLNNTTGLTCASWTCTTATIAAAAAPDGSWSAADITMGGGTVDSAAAVGYANSTTVYPRLWAKCSSGTLTIAHQGGTGSWTVNCTTVGGAWAMLTSTHAAVTVGAAWTSDGSGEVTMRLSGTDAAVWAPTVTEEPGTGLMVIPTAGTITTTGDPVWAIDNTSDEYYKTGDTVTQSIDGEVGTCFVVSGTDLLLSGASTCNGLWDSLTVTR